LIQRDDCKSFTIAKDIDPNYANALTKAVKKKLNILCYDCKFSSKGIKLSNKVKFKIWRIKILKRHLKKPELLDQ